MEKEKDSILDGENAINTDAEDKEPEKKDELPDDPYALLRKISRGTLKLVEPIRAASRDVTEIDYDFCALNGEELLDVLDSVPAINYISITNTQALRLFAAAAVKCAPFVDSKGPNKTLLYDETDIRKRLCGVDALKASRLAKNFYSASFRVERINSSNG